MAYYTAKTDLIQAAGGELKLNELADLDGDGEADTAALAAAQTKADAWINAHLARLNGSRLPYAAGEVPDLVRLLAADETVYRLKVARGMNARLDDEDREIRAKELESLELGKTIPSTADTYPIGDGGGTPVVRARSSSRTSDSTSEGSETKDSMKGFW